MSQDQRDTRREYDSGALNRRQLQADPVAQFQSWLEAAIAVPIVDATAMTLATVDSTGMPSARIVLLKAYNQEGFTWYTSYSSQKGEELAQNPQASLLFYWHGLERQVRINGSVSKLSRQDAEEYFASRPTESKFAAAASAQSQAVADRETLERAVSALQMQYPDGDVPAPQDWGGYQLAPTSFEFWQGREGRLHDRFRYQQQGDAWHVERLQP